MLGGIFIFSLVIVSGMGAPEGEDCSVCYKRVTYLWEKMNGPEAQAYLKSLVKKNLDCPKDILCNNVATDMVLEYIGKNVLFTKEEAKHVCDEFEGACKRYF